MDVMFENLKYIVDFYLMIPVYVYSGEEEDGIVLDMTGNIDADFCA